jgi:hypothetical protein
MIFVFHALSKYTVNLKRLKLFTVSKNKFGKNLLVRIKYDLKKTLKSRKENKQLVNELG